jgi:hypothetical protein
LGKSKEALLYLETAIHASPKTLNKFIALNPSVLQNPQVVDIIARNKRNRSKGKNNK